MTEFEQKDINIANSIYSGDLNTFKKFIKTPFIKNYEKIFKI